jgi:hypothetical protein
MEAEMAKLSQKCHFPEIAAILCNHLQTNQH